MANDERKAVKVPAWRLLEPVPPEVRAQWLRDDYDPQEWEDVPEEPPWV
jgi:Uma2 family endonuclease